MFLVDVLDWLPLIITFLGFAVLGGVIQYDDRRQRRPRTKAEIQRERRELYERTCREIDKLVAKYHRKLPRNLAKAIGVIYARYSTRHQDSIADQVRELLKYAVKDGIFVPREMIFFDLAVKGFKKNRVGLNRVREALKKKQASVLLLFATNRLFRKTYRTLEFVDQVHKGWGIRCVFVKSGVDTDDKQRWEALLYMQSMYDQFVVTMYVENIRAAHEGLLDKHLVFGTLSYGFGGEPIEGMFTRRGKPRCRIIIDPVTAEVVCRIFSWYVDERVSINEIIRRLNDDPSILLPPRCTSGEWTRLAVRGILRSTRYRALWKYGVTETVYLPEEDYDRQVMRAEPLREIQIEELRIVSDAIWYKAQERLAKEGRNGGRRSKDGDRRSRPRVLGGLFFCPKHERPLYVGGAYGKHFYCPSCARLPAKQRALFTTLNRKLALERTCEKLAELVSADHELVHMVIDGCRRAAEAAQKPDPRRLAQLRSRDEQLTRSIDFTRKNVGESEEDQAEAAQAIKEFLAERASVRAETKELEEASTKRITVPSEAEVREMVGQLGEVFAAAMLDVPDEQAGNVRAVIDMMTGGQILLFQQGERKPHAGWLQGRFRVRLLSVLTEQATGVPSTEMDEGVEVVIDYKRPVPFEEEAEQAWQLYKQDKLNQQIALELKCSKSKVTKLLKYAAKKHGETLVDGRSRRAKLAQKHMEPPLYQQIVDEVMKRWADGMLMEEIAEELGVDRNTVTKVVAFWHTSRGLPVPDGRTRRKQLVRKTRRRRSTG